MDFILNWLPEVVTALLGGGIVAIFTVPEKKAAAKLDNAERVVAKYEQVLAKYEKRIEELERQVKDLEAKLSRKDERIEELENKINAFEQKRNARGQFCKKQQHTTDSSHANVSK